MKKNGMSALKRRLLITFCCLVQARYAEDPFGGFGMSVNKDFPTMRKTVVFRDRFAHDNGRWHIDSTFPGVLSYDKALVLTPARKKDKEYGIALKLYRSAYPIGGKKYEFSAMLSGRGKAKVGMIIYGNYRDGRPAHRIFWSGEYDLEPVARKFVLDADCSCQRVYQIALLLHIDAGGELTCHKTEFSEISDSSVDIKSPYLLLVKKGDRLPSFHFDVRPTGDVKHPMILLSSDENNVNSSSAATADDKGRVYPPRAVINVKTGYTLSINGTTSTTYVLPISSSDYERCDELAKRIRLKKPLRIVILGDSLLDKDFVINVGCGACEQLFFWLNKYNHGLVTVKNLAVGGDNLRRVEKRMRRELGHSEKRVFKQRIYTGMFDGDADLVFIQFGNTDTAFRTMDSESRDRDGVDDENIGEPLREIMKNCREHWPDAKVVVFSSTSSCEDICRKRHRELRKLVPDRIFSLYGVPERLEKYNAIAKAAAETSGARFYDIYSEMKALPYETKVRYSHRTDGVHLSPDGHVYMTMKYLELLNDIIGESQ